MSRLVRSPIEVIAVLAGVGGVMLVLYAWHLPPFKSSVETTDDAYVKGYVTTISPQVSGYITDVPIKDYKLVKQGEVLTKIDDRIYQQKVAQRARRWPARRRRLPIRSSRSKPPRPASPPARRRSTAPMPR
ncbi:putative HlyD family secretion protein [Rhizobium rhizogenes NBRC 13257]|uniref:HlyD family secretion protein n=1 Tax=Rhizobium rhizogenes NBRC 13257 TaxID=1220581 RepID=A0AA87U6K3_RHIRH|nr:putative HlyD family secretion protein [Rhizobium rhizogenes NBRC 13257]